MRSGSVSIDGVSLAYDEWGEGEALFCLHGGMGIDSSYMKHRGVAGLAGADRRVIVYDQRGHGRSDRPGAAGYTHARWAEDLRGLASALAPGRFALLGHSYGGFLALEYALRHPETLTHLLLVGTSAGPVHGEWPHLRSDAAVETYYRRRWNRFFAGPDRHEDVLERLSFSWEPYEAAFHGELPFFDLRDRVRGLDVPALLLVGSEDSYRPAMESLAKSMPRAELEVIPRAGHFVFLEEPDLFRERAGRFLSARFPSRPPETTGRNRDE